MVDGYIIALLQIGDPAGEGSDRQGVGAQEHLAFAIAHHQGAAPAGAHDQVVFPLNQHRQGEGPGQPIQRRLQRLQRRQPRAQLRIQHLGDHLGVGVALESPALSLKVAFQLGEVLDDAVVHQTDPAGDLRMGVGLVGCAVGGPAGVTNPHRGGQGPIGQHRFQGCDLALRPAPLNLAADHPGHAGRIIAAVFQPLEGIEQPGLDRDIPDDADDAAHRRPSFCRNPKRG